MIVEERIYTVQIGKAKEWLDFYGEHGFPVQQKHLGTCIGFFTSEIGALNQIVHLWSFDSLAHRESARAEMAKDPAWHAYVTGQPKVLISQENRILLPTAFSPLQ
jgi:hypothetical protein